MRYSENRRDYDQRGRRCSSSRWRWAASRSWRRRTAALGPVGAAVVVAPARRAGTAASSPPPAVPSRPSKPASPSTIVLGRGGVTTVDTAGTQRPAPPSSPPLPYRGWVGSDAAIGGAGRACRWGLPLMAASADPAGGDDARVGDGCDEWGPSCSAAPSRRHRDGRVASAAGSVDSPASRCSAAGSRYCLMVVAVVAAEPGPRLLLRSGCGRRGSVSPAAPAGTRRAKTPPPPNSPAAPPRSSSVASSS